MGATAATLAAATSTNQQGIGSVVNLATMGAQTYGSVSAQRAQANATVAQGNFQKTLNDLQATDALARGDQSANRVGMQTRSLIGTERANGGASGVDVNSGSAADVQADSARLGAMDRLTIKNNAAREAWGFQTQGTLDQMAANNRADGQRAKATSTLLTGAADLYSAWQKNPPYFHRPTSSKAPRGPLDDPNPNHGME